jgi:putative transposase
VRRRFTAERANQVWLTDITEHHTGEGKLYLCAIKDVYLGRIVGYSIDQQMKASLAVASLRNAVILRGPAGTIVHFDRGSQFRSRKFVEALRADGLSGSVGRVGACGDNAAMESFFALLQKTCWTGTAGPPATSSGSQSSPGSRAPTTGAAAKPA